MKRKNVLKSIGQVTTGALLGLEANFHSASKTGDMPLDLTILFQGDSITDAERRLSTIKTKPFHHVYK